jgi:hypothetical protein
MAVAGAANFNAPKADPMTRYRPRMTVLAMYAQHGSCSYADITAARLREILQGAVPAYEELPSVRQAMTEMPAHLVPRLAEEIGMTADQIIRRTIQLCGEPPGLGF